MLVEATIERLDPVTAVFAIKGALTLGGKLNAVEEQMQQLLSSGVNRLILDLGECPYSDSSGLGFLVHTCGVIAAQGGSMRLCGVSQRIKSLLKLTRTEALLPCDETRQASVNLLSGPIAKT